MSNRARWILVVGLVGLAGLVAGVVMVLSLFVLGEEPVEPTLAPVAADVEVTTPPAGDTPQETMQTPQATAVPATASATPVIGGGEPAATSPQTAPPATTGAVSPTASPFITHTVRQDETLTAIAVGYNVSVEAITEANQLADENLIVPGQLLRIPIYPSDVGVVAAGAATPTAEATPQSTSSPATAASAGPTATTAGPSTAATPSGWPPSIISGDLSGNYPLQAATGSGALIIHYQPDTYPAANIDTLAPTIDNIFAELQTRMGGQVPQVVDVYLGGTLFGVNPSLQGFTQSYEFRSFVLVNGAFHRGERDYILGHELSHVAATHILGPASSTMIHEGLATYLPQRYLTEEAGYLPIEQICAAAYHGGAFRSAGQLSQLSYGATAFGGHIRTFFNYNLSGCFVGYLLQTYSMEMLDEVYDSGDYAGVYGLSLGELDQAWQATLQTVPLTVDAEAFVGVVQDVANAYETYVTASAGGHHENYEAYQHLNQARLAANRGQLQAARQELDTYWALMGF